MSRFVKVVRHKDPTMSHVAYLYQDMSKHGYFLSHTSPESVGGKDVTAMFGWRGGTCAFGCTNQVLYVSQKIDRFAEVSPSDVEVKGYLIRDTR